MKLSIEITPEMRVRLMYAETVEIDVPVSCVVPEGWKLVPLEPTPDMSLNAMMKATIKYRCQDAYRRVYRAMLAAAPQPEEGTI